MLMLSSVFTLSLNVSPSGCVLGFGPARSGSPSFTEYLLCPGLFSFGYYLSEGLLRACGLSVVVVRRLSWALTSVGAATPVLSAVLLILAQCCTRVHLENDKKVCYCTETPASAECFKQTPIGGFSMSHVSPAHHSFQYIHTLFIQGHLIEHSYSKYQTFCFHICIFQKWKKNE